MQLLQHFKEFSLHPKNAAELRGLILQLAIQGKLTANWRVEHPYVEPSSVMLGKIHDDKTQLIKEKKIKKEKPLTSITKKEIPFELPNTWTWCHLNDLGIIGSSSRVHKKDWQTEGVPFYRAREIVKLSRFGIVDNNLFISEELFNKFKESGSVPDTNDIMITGVGTIGIPYIVKKADRFYFKDASVLIFKNIFNLYSDYLNLFFNCQYWVNEIHKNSMGTTVHTLTISRAKLVPTILPPLEEQKEIVKVVETLFKEVEQLEVLTKQRIQLKSDFVTSALRQLTTADTEKEWASLQSYFFTFFTEKTNVKKLREGILQLAVQGKLTKSWRKQRSLSGFEVEDASVLLARIKAEKEQLVKAKKIKKEKPLPKVRDDEVSCNLPEGWVWCRLQDLVNVGTGSTPATSNSSYYGGEVPWYTSSATNNLFAKESEKRITEKALRETNCKVFPEGTLIIAMYGQGKTRGQISELVIPGATNQAVAAMIFYKTSKDFKEYLKCFFRKIYNEIRLLAEGGAQPNLNVGKIKNTILPLPPIEEQKAIAEKVNTLMGLCDALEQEVHKSQEHSEQLMQSCLREVFNEEANKVEL